MHIKAAQFKDANCRRIWKDRLCKLWGAAKYAVQKMTDRPENVQEQRMLDYWQHLDWMYSIIKMKNAGVLEGLVADPPSICSGCR